MKNAVMLYILCGLPFSGKTTLQTELVKRFGFQAVSVDLIMDERDMWREGHPTQDDWNIGYSEAYRQVQDHLMAGETVIFDCANLRFHEREAARQIAERLGRPYRLIYVNTPREEILRRRQRNEETKERGPVDQEMMEAAQQMFDEPTESERPILYNYRTDMEEWAGNLR